MHPILHSILKEHQITTLAVFVRQALKLYPILNEHQITTVHELQQRWECVLYPILKEHHPKRLEGRTSGAEKNITQAERACPFEQQ